MSEREEFLAAIKALCIIGCGWTEQNWDKCHDWNYFFDMGYRADSVREAFDEARRCE